MKKLKGVAFLLYTLSVCSCTLTDNAMPDVFYIHLSSPKVKLPFINGDDTHKISEVWVFADGQILGIFPLPAKIPITYTGKDTEITILAGIRNNGMFDHPVFYPFYKSIDKVVNVGKGQILTFPLEFSYVDNAKFPIIESFEANHCFTLDLDGKQKPELAISTESASTGTKAAKFILTAVDNFAELACTQLIKKKEVAGGKSYLELDYKGHGEIAIGLLKIGNGLPKTNYILYIPAKENWNKLYIEMTELTSANDYDEYSVIIAIRKTGFEQESTVFVDNIKHIHF